MKKMQLVHKIGAAMLCLSAGTAFGADMTRRSHGDGNDVGVGIGFAGAPGLSLYGELSRERFLQGSFGFANQGDYIATADYAFAYPNAFRGAPILTPFWGLGAVVLHEEGRYWVRNAVEDDSMTYIGARIPLGLNLVIPKTPVQFAANVAPTMLVTPATYAYVEGALSVRVLF